MTTLPARAKRVLRSLQRGIPSGVVIGRRSAGVGPAEFIELDEIQQAQLDEISTTRGSILYRGASAWAALAPGTAGHFLQTQGANMDPIWAAASGGGGGLNSTLVYQSSTVGGLGSSTYVVSFNTTDHDTLNIFDGASSTTDFVIPAALDGERLIFWGAARGVGVANAQRWRMLIARTTGATLPGQPVFEADMGASSDPGAMVMTGPIIVSENDVFRLQIQCSDGSWSLNANNALFAAMQVS